MVFKEIGDFLNVILNPLLAPLLSIPPLWAIIIMSFLISLIVSVIYKYTTNQDLMRQLKSETKELQNEMKTLKQNPQKMGEVQKKAMETNMKYMTQSFKSTLFTFIPILLIFSWMGAHLAYYPILPGEEFTTTVAFEDGIGSNITLIVPNEITLLSDAEQKVNADVVKWKLKGSEGSYGLTYKINEKEYEKDVLITSERNYFPVEKVVNDDLIKTIKIDNEPVKPLNLFGWKVGWLGTYIIFSLIFSMALRKFMKLA